MYYLDEFNNNFIICDNKTKKQILDQMNQSEMLYNISFLSLESFYTSLTFEINKELIYYVMKELNVTYDVANTYLKSLKDIYFINESNNEKVLFLLSLKEKLIKNSYIKQTNTLRYYNSKRFIILNYDYIENKYLLALNQLQNYKIINYSKKQKKDLQVLEFNTIEDEINYTFESIIKLLIQGIDLNNIKIATASSDYNFLLNKFSKMYKLPVTIENERSLYSTNIGKEFLKTLKLNEHLNYLENLKQKNSQYYNIIINILNEFTFVDDYKEVYSLIVNEFKKKYINELYFNDIKVMNINEIIPSDKDYVFVLGLNQGKIPHITKDEDYLNDEIKQKLNLSTTVDLNKATKEQTINKLYEIKNLFLSYSLATTFSSLLPSSIISEYSMKVIKNNKLDYNYSNVFNNYALTSKLDDYMKYKTTSNELYSLVSSYELADYDSYNNEFKGINTNNLQKKLNNKVNLSYTSLNEYNECKFKYYIDYILKLNIYEDTFYTSLGSTFHEVLSYAFNEDFNFEESFIKAKEKYFTNITKKDEFLLKKLKEELKFIIETIHYQLEYINYDKLLTEEEVNIEINSNCTIKFKGIIDKILYKEEENNTFVALVDYKTGTIDPSILNSKYGLNLQLPIYLYLSKKSKLKNVIVTGFYYQTILQNEMKAEDDEEYLDKKQKYLKLQGYTLDSDELPKITNKDNEANLIQGLRRKTDDSYYATSKVLNLFQMKKLEKLVENFIISSGNSIINGDFAINPKIIGYENESCKYCKYKDLCFRKDKDIKKYDKAKDLSFLEEYE